MEEKYCWKCGSKLPEDTSFCPKCGVSIKMNRDQIIVVTTPAISGYEIVRVLGIVHGLTVRTRGVGGKIVAGIEGMFGGEVTSYSSEAEKARRESLERLIDNTRKMGANAIVRADFETSDILQGTATLFSAYGTAVIIKPIRVEG
ncbi:MAG: heavy metal-binding domain-containing protein [Candidatus Bathyarchaeota archaeon]|nr:heavy metal-binding domain-containing protein [Candidatus Bathyarchaeota archaeon]